MSPTKCLAVAGVMALLTNTAAHALTADQVWSDWQANLAIVGLTLTADPATPSGGEMVLRNIAVGDGGETLFALDQITLTETAGGTVAVSFPPEFAIRPAPHEDVTVDVSVAQSGLVVTVSEPAPGARLYDYAADRLALSGTFVQMIDMFDGGEKQPDTSDFSLSLGGMTGTYSDTPAANRNFTTAIAADTIAFDLNQSGPFVGQSTQTSSAQDFAMQGSFTLPANLDLMTMENPGQMADALRDGLAATLTFTQGPGSSDQSTTSEFLSFAVKTAAEGSSFRGSFDQSGILFAGESLPVTATITSPEMPFPQLDLAVGPSAMELKFPVVGPEVQDFRYMIRLDSVTVNDEAWAAIDPTAVLERTPIVLDIDVTGRTSLDMFGLVQSSDDGTPPPIPQVERADIVRLLVSAAGAEVSGTGAFTFDNSAGFPMPRGNADFVVKGANKMVDALITLGVITSDDAMGARMAMALILDPTDEPDVMTSKIEARDDGGVYVNGQRMR
jgi:hypothetical protein